MNNKPLIRKMLRENLDEGLIVMDSNLRNSVHSMLRGFGLRPGTEEFKMIWHSVVNNISDELSKISDIKIV